MSYTVGDVEVWLGRGEGDLNQDILDRIKAAVDSYAADRYDLTSPTERHDQALIEECARRYRRKVSSGNTSGTGDASPIFVTSFDVDIAELLADRLITAGMFGPSANT
jgi:hypothetical protein